MKYVFVNFKTNKYKSEFIDYFNYLNNCSSIQLIIRSNKVVFFLNSFYSLTIKDMFSNFNIGNQSCDYFNLGSYTSAVSVNQLKHDGIDYVLLNHSEEIKYFNETVYDVNLKLTSAIKNNLTCVVCIGNIEECNNTKIIDILLSSISSILSNLKTIDFNKIIFAYEPIYAIGTGKALDIKTAEEIISNLKIKLLELYKFNFSILYGGSVDINNISSFFQSTIIDGVLIGKQGLDCVKMKDILEMNLLNYEK